MKPTIVALHGFLGRGGDWDAVRAASRRDSHWICPDLFGVDSSFEPPTVDGPCWLAGYSFGARLALRWMQDAPDKWRGALLLSVNPGNFQTDDDRAARRVSDKAWAAAFRAEEWDQLLARWNAQSVFGGGTAPLRAAKDFDRAKLAGAFADFSVADQFTDPLRLPSRLVWLAGAKDGKYIGLQTKMREAGFPGSFLRIEEAGHRLLHEAPQAVAAALDDLTA